MRWEKIMNSSTELESHLLRAEVLWGTSLSFLIKPLSEKINKLNTALRQNFDPSIRTMDYAEIHDIIYDKGGVESADTFSQEVNLLIKKISTYLQGKM